MSTTELKANFHQLIDRIEDEEQLRDLYEALGEHAYEKGELHTLTPEEVSRITSSLEKIERDETIPNEVVMQHMKEWLSK